MSKPISRRQALQVMGGGALALMTGCNSLGHRTCGGFSSGRWYRGNLHMHTYWSDGQAFPEQAIGIYKGLGYDFLSLSDHNIFADNPNEWRTVADKVTTWPPEVITSVFDAYMAEYGQEADIRQAEGKTQVRLKTYEEMCKRFEEPGRFLLIPGVEITQARDDINVHQNYFNLPDVIPDLKGGPLVKDFKDSGMNETALIAHHVREVSAMAEAMGRPSMLMLNHPQWIYWDIQPQYLIDNPEVRFFEVCNGGSAYPPHPEAMRVTLDSFWDAINAFRSIQGAPLLFGVGSDDTHVYLNLRPNQRLTEAWVMVRATNLSTESLLDAMDAGDYYASTGVFLEDLAFDTRKRALHVKVHAEQGVRYRICFITTKLGFDPSVHMVDCPAESDRTARTIPVYSEDIGRTVKVVEGLEASYQMASDDLYVRAKIISDIPSDNASHFHPTHQVAWTQPYA